LVPEFPE
jgi:hypothetical protein